MADLQFEMAEKYADQQSFPWDDHAGGWVIKDLDGDTRVWVTPLLFTHAVIVGPADADMYIDRWCYHSAEAAIAASTAWNGPYPATEPAGWHRHPTSGRRRAEGDPAREHIAH